MNAPSVILPNVILIVEDAPDCRESLEIALEGMKDCRVVCATSAEQALILFGQHKIAAVITDLHLPDMDGFAMIAELRSQPLCAKLPIVVTSGDTTAVTRGRLAHLKVDAFFAKRLTTAGATK